ncbi:[acyl-carrier-protein] S-malonyltransferase [Pleurocapsa sp. CCALA 161]|uniref:ACP S-malonyltransferase n=1 Tax=Pleurocapsa sp. CCALA 161 TaxID=2107688 RepID=UPI000D04F786|nr:ACP S-malonyltransferase [Pleurocapsa sp. CCALA 161]PSB08815.1 [acyl-carrier-protein] S-malonyltransferase [Pleurocapsa sp. CCALA 161]
MTKTAWVFPGQGSQLIGMGVDLQDIPVAKAKFELAEKILGWSVLDICQGDETTLACTLYTQPCLYVVESILSDLLKGKVDLPQLVAGHSLGEYVALYAAEVFDFESGLRLVKKRAELMHSADGGKMAALMKFDRDQLTTVLNNTPDVVLANDNSEAQVVISGTPEGVENVLSQVKAKKAIALNVSGAFHSPLMQGAAKEFLTVLESVEFKEAKIPVLSNVDPRPTTDSQVLKSKLTQQMTNSVRWRETMLQLAQAGVTEIIEIGPGKVLCGLIKRTCKDIALEAIGTVEQLDGKAPALVS